MRFCLLCEGVAPNDVSVCASCGCRLAHVSEVHVPLRRGEEDASHPLLGTLIDGKYRVNGVLGRGGMGTVFRATHEVSLVPIALKLLHPRLAARPEYRAQFLAEARKAGRVVHEHTARVLDVGEMQDGSIFLAQELAPGRALHDWLLERDALGVAATVAILRQVTSALVAAHGVGLVHRDLTPRNVMIDVRDGQPHVKVLDFGIARASAERSDDGAAGFATPPYAAPEQLSGQEIDGRADLYSLGVIAYEALCGELPTAGQSAREFAQATVRGELRPLRPRERTPAALLRLIEALLARDPARRPASAQVVLAKLDALRAPRGGTLRAVALVALLLATLAFAYTYREPAPPPFLRLLPNQALELFAVLPRGAPVQELRPAQLSSLRLEYGYFDASRLVAEVWQNGDVVAQIAVGTPRATRTGGTLSFEPGDAEFERLLAVLADYSRHAAVHLNFVVPGRVRTTLASAALRIDDDPPDLNLRVASPGSDGGLLGSSALVLAVRERSLASLSLVLAFDNRERTLALDVDSREVGAELLRDLLPPPLPVSDVTLWLVGRDAAGNQSRSQALHCPVIDLGVPRLVGASGTHGDGRSLVLGASGVRLRLALDGREPDLRVWFGVHGGELAPCLDVVDAGRGLEVLWPVEGRRPEPGRYEALVRDRAGNETRYTDSFTFETIDLAAKLTIASHETPAHAVLDGDSLFSDGAPFTLQLRCNALYRPEAAMVLSAASTSPLADRAATLRQVADGAAYVDLPSLEDGRYRLAVQLRNVSGERVESAYPLAVARRPIVLRVPATQRRYVPQLHELGVLSYIDGAVGPGRAWVFEPADGRWLRGTVWFGAQQLTSRPIHARDAVLPLFTPLRPLPGESVLGLCLRDVLGRPVSVRRGEHEAPALGDLRDERGQSVVEVARFLWRDDKPRLRQATAGVEFGQPTRLVVDAPLPYAIDEVELELDGMPLRAKARVPRSDGGVALEFELPFDRLVTAAGFAELTANDYAEERTSAPLALILGAPDGRHTLDVRVRTQRTTMEPVRLGVLALPAAAARLRAALAEIEMVPVLGPGVGRAWLDPVPRDVPDRAAFRTLPPIDVRNIEDYYLQRGEMTRAQYAAIVAGLLAELGPGGLGEDELIHFGDPQRGDRLTSKGLLPRIYRGDQSAFEADLSAEPTAPVVGVDFFQAHCVARACGWLLVRDVDLLRLPFGAELELAALGPLHTPQVDSARNGAARQGGVRLIAAYAAAIAGRRGDAAELGDRVVGHAGNEMFGVDFGVREWVADLPLLPVEFGRALIEAQRSDHALHQQAAAELARGQAAPEMIRALLQFGMVRGMATSELIPAPLGAPPSVEARVSADLPGVVRILQLARDGRGALPGELDPHLGRIGLRLAGGRAFRTAVRAR